MKGKKKCELLKTIRCRVAKANGVDYTATECNYQGECKGTCPKCEEELRQLTAELDRIRESGKRVAVAGLAATLIAGSAAGCEDLKKGFGDTDVMGIVPAPQVEVLDGDLVMPEQGEIAEEAPEAESFPLSAVLTLAEETIPGYLAEAERSALKELWAPYFVQSEGDTDVYYVAPSYLELTFDESGRVVAALKHS